MGENYFHTLCEPEELLDGNVDLIELEECKFKEDIEKIGKRKK